MREVRPEIGAYRRRAALAATAHAMFTAQRHKARSLSASSRWQKAISRLSTTVSPDGLYNYKRRRRHSPSQPRLPRILTTQNLTRSVHVILVCGCDTVKRGAPSHHADSNAPFTLHELGKFASKREGPDPDG
jgi:hypothetical protein